MMVIIRLFPSMNGWPSKTTKKKQQKKVKSSRVSYHDKIRKRKKREVTFNNTVGESSC